jgi:hypothetical protein
MQLDKPDLRQPFWEAADRAGLDETLAGHIRFFPPGVGGGLA